MAGTPRADGPTDPDGHTDPTSPTWLPPSLAGAVPASLLRRVGAIAIDWFAAIVIARLIFPGAEYGSAESAFATLAIFAVEVIVFTWLTGSSFGQRIIGIAVVGPGGQRLSLWRCVIRTLLICLVVPALVYDSKRRGLHDLAVGSIVLVRRTIPGMGR
jgi:uncharacterized RDD family membrane protein YckC